MLASMLVCLAAAAAGPSRPVHTYSIVARDPGTGDLGIAVQSHWFSVGAGCPGRRREWGRWPRSRSSIRPMGRWGSR